MQGDVITYNDVDMNSRGVTLRKKKQPTKESKHNTTEQEQARQNQDKTSPYRGPIPMEVDPLLARRVKLNAGILRSVHNMLCHLIHCVYRLI